MAGSFNHVLDEASENYRGVSLLENMGDMTEAIEEMAFMLLRLQHLPGGKRAVDLFRSEYYACVRGDTPWPEWMRHGLENDNRI
jgi:hypothetical protein